MIADILGKNRLHGLDFNIPVGKVTAWQAVMLNKAAEELPSESDITRVDDIELQEIAEKATKSTEDLTSHLNEQQSQTDDLFKHPFWIRFTTNLITFGKVRLLLRSWQNTGKKNLR